MLEAIIMHEQIIISLGTSIIAILSYHFYYYKKERQADVFKQNLKIYSEISRKIVLTKKDFEETIGRLINLIKNDELIEENYHMIEDELRNILSQLYEIIYSNAFLLPSDIYKLLEEIYTDIAEYAAFNINKNIISNSENQIKLDKKFSKALIILSEKIEVGNTIINIKNPHGITNKFRPTDKEIEEKKPEPENKV